MPTYQEALAADPTGFVDCAAEMSSAGTDLTDHRTAYDAKVNEINAGWQDRANTAFNDDVALVDTHVEDVVSRVGEAAETLSAGGSQMASQVEQLKATDAVYRGAGFTVQPEPRVELGAVHWAAIAAAGPFGPMLQALFQARADEGTTQLRLGLAMLTVTDAVTGAALTAAAQQLKPMEDKDDTGSTIWPPVIGTEDQPKSGKDDTEGKDENDTDTDTDTAKKDPDEDGDKDAKDKDDKDKDGKKDDEEKPDPNEQDQQPETPQSEQPETEQPENQIPGTESPDSVPPVVPDYETDPGDFTAPELPENNWDPSELGGDEPLSGGLAGGGGGLGGGPAGGGLGAADAPSGGGSGVGGVIGATTASAPPMGTTGSGGRTGTGGLLGSPGARGPADPDDEFERESFLVEDPEEDVWGIGSAENNPYVDFQDEQPEAAVPPALALDETSPFTFPGFDLPGIDKP